MCVKNCSNGLSHVSSTYLFHTLGCFSAVIRAVISKSSMNMLTITGDRGYPIAVPFFC